MEKSKLLEDARNVRPGRMITFEVTLEEFIDAVMLGQVIEYANNRAGRISASRVKRIAA